MLDFQSDSVLVNGLVYFPHTVTFPKAMFSHVFSISCVHILHVQLNIGHEQHLYVLLSDTTST